MRFPQLQQKEIQSDPPHPHSTKSRHSPLNHSLILVYFRPLFPFTFPLFLAAPFLAQLRYSHHFQSSRRVCSLTPSSLSNGIQDFKTAATGVSAKAMRNELNAMIQKIDDPEYKKVSRSSLSHLLPRQWGTDAKLECVHRRSRQRCNLSSFSSTDT